ncbi:hypothetical protein Bbelb_026590 [Branchiostoma belcheri]|nr:hypothetical protein Bbelb_026590 [Branchiostoma belcheri]
MAADAVTEEMVRNIIKQEQFSIKAKQDELEDRTEVLAHQQELLKKENNSLKGEVSQMMLVLQQEARRWENLIVVGTGRGSTRLKRAYRTTKKRHNPFNGPMASNLHPDLPNETDEENQNSGDSAVTTAEGSGDNLYSWWARNVCVPLKTKLGKAVDSFFQYFHVRYQMRPKNRKRRRNFERTKRASSERNSTG